MKKTICLLATVMMSMAAFAGPRPYDIPGYHHDNSGLGVFGAVILLIISLVCLIMGRKRDE